MAKNKLLDLHIGVDFDTKDVAAGLAKVAASAASFGTSIAKTFPSIAKVGGKAFGDMAKSSEKSLGHLAKHGSKSFGDLAKSSEKTFGHVSKSAASSLGSVTKLIASVHKDWAGLGKSLLGGGGGRGLIGGLTQGLGIGAGIAAFKGLTSAITAPFTNIGQAILDSSEIETVDRKFKAVFGNMTADAEKFAKEFSGKVGQSESGIKGTMSRFQDTLVPMGFGRKQATDISKNMTGLSTDLAASEGITQTEAADRIVSGMVGNHEALRRFGVVITETTLNAKLMAMGIKGGGKAATEQEKAMARLNLVIAGTRDAQGTAARASGSFATEMGSFNAMVKQVSGTIGNVFKPAATEILKFFREGLSNLGGNLSGATEWGKSLGEAAKNVLEKLKEVRAWVETSIGGVGEYFGKIAGFLAHATKDGDTFKATIADIGALLQDSFAFAFGSLQTEGTKVLGALSGGVMGAIGMAGDEIRAIMKEVGGILGDLMDIITSKIKNVQTIGKITMAMLSPGGGGMNAGVQAGAAIGGDNSAISGGPSASKQIAEIFGRDRSGSGPDKDIATRIAEGARAGYEGAAEGVGGSELAKSQADRKARMDAASGRLGAAAQAGKDAAGLDGKTASLADIRSEKDRLSSEIGLFATKEVTPERRANVQKRLSELDTLEKDSIANGGKEDGKLSEIKKPGGGLLSILSGTFSKAATGIAGELAKSVPSMKPNEGGVKLDKDGNPILESSPMATLAALGESAIENVGYKKPKAQVQYGDAQGTFKSIQSSLGGKDEKKEALRMAIIQKQKELAEKQLVELQKAPKAIAEMIGKTWKDLGLAGLG